MEERFSRLPRALQAVTRYERLGPTDVPALVAHPHDWTEPAPVAIWMHGRTVSKELDAGRYLRWIRAGVGVCAIDLPGHGERLGQGPDAHDPTNSLDTIATALPEIDHVVSELTSDRFGSAFDPDRLAIGGMSLGGMVTLRRLADPHPFAAGAVEATCGSLRDLYFPQDPSDGAPWSHHHAPEAVRPVDPIEHLPTWRPLPLLVLHSETDEMVPWGAQKRFLDELRNVPGQGEVLEVKTWPETGAPREHLGFGSFSNEAKNLQTEFLARHLNATPPA